ncbi:MAG TPA: membrane protein insertase YidC [Verrucomicrobiae bacterium]|jgi:YidC/Oxa1 family membrane protein insertase|nr:membrane protein insertase YidC [Verrucomicrobiae bacterium]
MVGRRPWRPLLLRLPIVVGLLAGAPVPVAANETDGRVRVATERLEVVLALDGARPVTWRACRPSCLRADAESGTSIRFTGAGDAAQPRLVLHGAGGPIDLGRLRFIADANGEDPASRVTLRTDLPVAGVRLEESFALSRDGYETALTVRLVGPGAAAFTATARPALEVAPGRDLLPAPAAGFAALLERVGRVAVAGGAVHAVAEPPGPGTTLRAGEWAGVRGRFWAMLARPEGAGAAVEPRPGPGVALAAPAASGPAPTEWRYTIYAGPVEREALSRADPELERLLLSGLWWWLRALALGLLALLHGWIAWLGHPGVAVMALAVSVKVLLLPLAAVAERLQEQVNATQARLQPGLDAINAAHRGEERTRRTLALYRELGVHPLYTLKSLAGFLIQIPVFIAVFDMLAEDVDLYRVPFLWIRDLSRPDAVATLPACVPFFGCDLNLLPFLMSAVSLATLLRFRSPVLTPALVRRQRRNLAGMTLLFFLLFYTFPAGMVLYWTSTNAFQLLSQEVTRGWRARPARR